MLCTSKDFKMTRLMFLPLVFLLYFSSPCRAYSSGSPTSQCNSMTPGHEQTPQDNTNAPYEVKLSAGKIVKGSPVDVELKSKSGGTFKGFIIEARSVAGNKIIGSFQTINSDARYVGCDGVPQSAVTHTSPAPKKSVRVRWTAPSDFTGSVKVLATFVREYQTYWVKLESETLEVSSEDAGIVFPSSPEPESESEPEAESEAEPEAEPESEPEAEAEPEGEPESSGAKSGLYADCGSSKSCLGVPDKCIEKSNCRLFASWKKVSSGYEWELSSANRAGSYVAVGFSSDNKMGDDLVMACAGNSKAELYWNAGKRKPDFLDTKEGILEYSLKREDNTLYCKIKTAEAISAGSHSVDLSQDHNLLLAGGPYSSAGNLGYHNQDKVASAEPVSLALVTSVGGSSDLLFRLHGLLMLCAWVGCAGVGMILARYFKNTWRGKQLGGKDLWFVFHRTLMVLTVLLSITAVVLVMVEVDIQPLALSNLKNNAHPVIGLTCVLLAILNPIMAVFRPHPGAPGRSLFNWAHWAVGNTAHICAVVAIFLAGTLAKANLSSTSWWSWTMMGYVIFHFLVHVILSFLMAREERSSKVRDTQLHVMSGKMVQEYEEIGDNEAGSGVRKLLGFVYAVIAWAVAAALIVAVFQA